MLYYIYLYYMLRTFCDTFSFMATLWNSCYDTFCTHFFSTHNFLDVGADDSRDDFKNLVFYTNIYAFCHNLSNMEVQNLAFSRIRKHEMLSFG